MLLVPCLFEPHHLCGMFAMYADVTAMLCGFIFVHFCDNCNSGFQTGSTESMVGVCNSIVKIFSNQFHRFGWALLLNIRCCPTMQSTFCYILQEHICAKQHFEHLVTCADRDFLLKVIACVLVQASTKNWQFVPNRASDGVWQNWRYWFLEKDCLP